MIRYFIITIFLFPLVLCSQITINGKVKDHLGELAGANIVLENKLGELTGTITELNGSFSIQVNKGTYTLTISYLGYKSYVKTIELVNSMNLGEIELQNDPNQLDEVVVTVRKKMIQQKADRIVFNVANSIAANMGNAMDALQVTPGLQVRNGSLTIFGKGSTQVMINNRLIPLTGDDLSSFLNGISGDDIEKIEVITAPPAQFDAAGNGGLVNIILKMGALNAWKNTLAITQNFDTYNYTSFRNNFSYRKDRLSLSTSIDKTRGHLRNLEDFKVYYPTSFWNLDINTKESQKAISGRVLLDYEVSDNFTLGVQYFGSNNQPNQSDYSITSIKNQSNTIDSLLINNGRDTRTNKSHAMNVHAISKLDTLGKTLSVDVDYFSYQAVADRVFDTKSYDPENRFLNVNLAATSNTNQSITNRSIKVDMIHPTQSINWSYGGKMVRTDSESGIEFYNMESGVAVLDTNISNTFQYKEDNYALYASSSFSLDKRWELQAGLRYENTRTKGFSKNLNQHNTNSYSKLFPTFYASFQKDESNTFSFSYSKRIQRPQFSNLNPFRVYVSNNTYSVGNPFLQPTFTDNFEFKYRYKSHLATNVFVNLKKDMSGAIFTSDVATNTQIVTRDNYLDQRIVGVGQSYIFNKVKWLDSQNSISLLHIDSEFTKAIDAPLENGMALNIATNNTISISDNSRVQLNAMYDSSVKYGLYSIGETFSLDIGFSTSFFNKSLQFSALVKDVFNTAALNNFSSTVNNVRQVYGQQKNNRYIRFSLRYGFGNKDIKSKNRQFGNQEESNRAN